MRGPHHPAEASQVLEQGLVRRDSQTVSSQQGVDRSPERTWEAELGGLGGPCWWQPGNGSAVEAGEAPGVGGGTGDDQNNSYVPTDLGVF